jgi:hypothetical protein
MKENIKINGPLVSLKFKKINIEKSRFLWDKRISSSKLQTSGLVPNEYYKPISKLCIVI